MPQERKKATTWWRLRCRGESETSSSVQRAVARIMNALRLTRVIGPSDRASDGAGCAGSAGPAARRVRYLDVEVGGCCACL